MSKINKIKLSGTSYDIEDLNAVHSLAGYATSAETQAAITGAVDTLAQSIAEQGYQTAQDVSDAISGKADTSAVTQVSDALTAHTANTTVHVTSTDKTNWDNKVSAIEYASASWIPGATRLRSTNNGSSYYNFAYVSPINGKPILSDGTNINQFSLVETSAITSAITSGSTNDEVPSAKIVYDKFDEVEQVTAAALNELNDAISGKVDISTYSAYTAATDTALASKQDTLSAGTGISISGNVISATGGGGKAVSGGTNISITTGETADTINCTLPITASTSIRKKDITIGNDIVNGTSDYKRITIGNGNKYQYSNSRTSSSILIATPSSTSSIYNVVKAANCIGIGGNGIEVGYDNIGGSGSIAIGYNSKSIINNSLAIGSNSVASGTTKTNINNQLTIDTSNQVYIYNKDNTEMICLQDQLGGGGASYSAGTGIDITNNVISVSGVVETSAIITAITSSSTDAQVPSAKIVYDKFDEVEQVTAAGLNAVNDKFGGLSLVKLTQTEYNNLQTKDNNTLYIIVN